MPQLRPVKPSNELSSITSSSSAEVDFSFDICLQVTLEIVHADITPTEEQNTTETAKTFKVNCDRRNITGMDNFSVQVLNASQVFMLSC